ncbi:hypothetical protein [Roseateles sp. L2-2]|uniref:hypothetical protein n=1 Tax=Roseateles sp. L2-2 TaxID=3422597 RepID=UPI003D36F732
MSTQLEAWIQRIRNSDPMTFEDAYFDARPEGVEVFPRLTEEPQAATDSFMRGKNP